jgi:hypothetical protein
MKRIVALLVVAASLGAAALWVPAFATDGPVQTYAQKVTLGFL